MASLDTKLSLCVPVYIVIIFFFFTWGLFVIFLFQGTSSEHPGGLPTMAAYVTSLTLLHPLYRLLWLGKTRDKLEPQFKPVIHEPGYDFHVVMLQTFSPQTSNSAGLIVHRQETDACFPLENFSVSNGLVSKNNRTKSLL